ncbi:glycerol-3-phosphate dehydrogenase/oxidase [Myxococcota bacterium]
MRSKGPSVRPSVDLVVIGGGVNGTGVARDAALRGLRVTLLESNDLGFGASGNSTGFVHGGPRYLTRDPGLTEELCRESGTIQRIAPHLVFRVPALLPVMTADPWPRVWLTLLDAFFRAYDRYRNLKNSHRHLRLSAAELQEIEPRLATGIQGGISFDECGIDGARLCIANALDAARHGAQILTHCAATAILRNQEGRVTRVAGRDRISGETVELRTEAVVAATGAWAPLTIRLAGIDSDHARVRPGKGIHVYFGSQLASCAVITQAIDGRQVFVLPWQDWTVVGTTDDDYYGDLEDVVATNDEVRYLLQAAARVLPGVLTARPLGTWAGVRPTLYAWGPNEDALSRDHQILDHAAQGVRGLYSMLGGKLSSYRLFAEQVTNQVATYLENQVECRTHRRPLPGGEEPVDVAALAEQGHIPTFVAQRLANRHGCSAMDIVRRIARHNRESALVCNCEPVTEAEIRYAVRREFARTVDDVARRTYLGRGPCGGMRCAARCGAIVAALTSRPAAEGLQMARDFVAQQARRRWPAMNPLSARQEALIRASVRAELDTRDAQVSCARWW